MGFDMVIFIQIVMQYYGKDVVSVRFCHKREDWRTVVTTAIHIWLYSEAGNFLCIAVTRTFSRMTLVLELITAGAVMCNISDTDSHSRKV
jgi:hypothetical protein